MVDDPGRIEPVKGISNINAARASMKKAQLQSRMQRMEAIQVMNQKSMTESQENVQFNPLAILRNGKNLKERIHKGDHSSHKQEEEDEVNQKKVEGLDDIESLAGEFHEKYPDLDPRTLLSVRVYIQEEDDPETILQKLLGVYHDAFLTDEALEFLLQTTSKERKLYPNLLKAKELLNERYGIEVRSGRNIYEQTTNFSKKGLGSPTALRDLYREIITNPRDPHDLFQELTDTFTFEKMKIVLSFLLHSVGADLKSKGPSISKQELMNIFHETRAMQAILGVYRFFMSRMNLLQNEFARYHLYYPEKMNFIELARVFMSYIKDRYPSPEKALSLADEMELQEIYAKILFLNQYRDAIRGVSPRLYKNNSHREDLLLTLLEALDDLEEMQEKEEEQKESDDEDEEQTI